MKDYEKHAMNEFLISGWCDRLGKFKDPRQQKICDHLIKMLELFYDEEYADSVTSHTVDLFYCLAKHEPIRPLTGEDWEWTKISDENAEIEIYQNNRCSRVFKQTDKFDGNAYDVSGKIFWSWEKGSDGSICRNSYVNDDSFVAVKFPYSPTQEFVFVPTQDFPSETLE